MFDTIKIVIVAVVFMFVLTVLQHISTHGVRSVVPDDLTWSKK